jgi:hypothetical protein
MSFKKRLLSLGLCLALSAVALAESQSVVWSVDALKSIGGHETTALGSPRVVETPYGKAVAFDGDGDRLLVNNNPLAGASEFTIEVIFRPNDVFPNNREPRFLHIEAPDNTDRRVTIELRLNDKQQWYLDSYIKSEKSQAVLIDETLVHPVNEWAHAAVTYKDRQFTAYVNGKKELVAEVEYLPIADHAATSIGARMNQVHWFNGDILQVRVTPKLLAPAEFLTVDKLEK